MIVYWRFTRGINIRVCIFFTFTNKVRYNKQVHACSVVRVIFLRYITMGFIENRPALTNIRHTSIHTNINVSVRFIPLNAKLGYGGNNAYSNCLLAHLTILKCVTFTSRLKRSYKWKRFKK